MWLGHWEAALIFYSLGLCCGCDLIYSYSIYDWVNAYMGFAQLTCPGTEYIYIIIVTIHRYSYPTISFFKTYSLNSLSEVRDLAVALYTRCFVFQFILII